MMSRCGYKGCVVETQSHELQEGSFYPTQMPLKSAALKMLKLKAANQAIRM